MSFKSLPPTTKILFIYSILKYSLKNRQIGEVVFEQGKIMLSQNFSADLSTETVHMFVLVFVIAAGQSDVGIAF